ncbi:MAG: HAD family phosphatase [Paracoccaceae bacterium]|nr:HAD family phosphatase [Paracoccaceae bacterium]
MTDSSTQRLIETVVFDIGNVLLHWEPEPFFDRVIGIDRRRRLFAHVDLRGMNERLDRGAPFRATIRRMADDHPEFEDEIRLWHDRWLEFCGPVHWHSVRLLRALRSSGMPVVALSNFGRETLTLAEHRWPFLTEFDARFISGELGVIKPEPAIYKILEDNHAVPPNRLLFTDDREENIQAARARGWQTHHFRSPEGLARCLVDRGLLTASAAAAAAADPMPDPT